MEPKLRLELGAFLDESFDYAGSNESYLEDFAPLFHGEDAVWQVERDETQKITATGALYKVEVQTFSGAKLKLGLLGGIATSPRARGQGLATKVISTLVEKAHALNCEAAVLWSQREDFYSKLGFSPYGAQNLLYVELGPTSEKDLLHEKKFSFEEVRLAEPNNLVFVKKLHQEFLHAGVLRTKNHWEGIAGISSCRVYVAFDLNRAPLAYIVHSRGKDMAGIVHEWGGTKDLVLMLMRNFAPQPLSILSTPRLNNLLIDGLKVIHEDQLPLCLIKWLQPKADHHKPDLWFWGLDSL